MLAPIDKMVGNTAPFAVTLYFLNHDAWSAPMICEPVNIDGSIDVKRCSKCAEYKSFLCFGPDKRAKDGLQSQCRDCKNAQERDDRKENPEKYHGYYKKNRLNNLENERAKARARYAENPEKYRELQKVRRAANPELIREKERDYRSIPEVRSRRLERRRITEKAIRDANPERHREISRRSKKKNVHKVRAATSERRSKKLQATPPWFSKQHRVAVQNLHLDALWVSMLTGTKHEVDHVHALQGENFSGLHVPWNMQVIPASINARKSNNPPANEIGMFWNFTKKQLEKLYGVK
jgi:hypothetical protein